MNLKILATVGLVSYEPISHKKTRIVGGGCVDPKVSCFAPPAELLPQLKR